MAKEAETKTKVETPKETKKEVTKTVGIHKNVKKVTKLAKGQALQF